MIKDARILANECLTKTAIHQNVTTPGQGAILQAYEKEYIPVVCIMIISKLQTKLAIVSAVERNRRSTLVVNVAEISLVV